MQIDEKWQESFANFDIDIKIEYFECVKPKIDPPCVCTKSEDKEKTCPDCTEWKKQTFSGSQQAAFDRDGYSYATGSPRANFLIRDVSESIYDVKFPTDSKGDPVTTSDLYNRFDEFDWMEVDEQSTLSGSIAVWDGMAGLVVDQESGKPIILYPSDRLKGELTVRPVESLNLGTPRYLIPKKLILDEDGNFIRLEKPTLISDDQN